MAETLFAFDNHNYTECQAAYRGTNNQEYYLGEYSIEAGPALDVRADKKTIGACSIIRMRSNTRQNFRRTWQHIREDATDVVVLWFVKSGELRISHPGGNSVARAGDFAISKSMTPFSIECDVDSQAGHEVLHVLVPTHIFRRYIAQDVTTGFATAVRGSGFEISQMIVNRLLEDVSDISEQTAERLLDGALSALADAIKGCDSLVQERLSITDRRLQDVLRYIEKHLSDSTLNTTTVARACGISPRYMSLLLKQNDLSFKELVWDKRLKIAGRWLASTSPNDITIAEVAFRVGFKSPAHFSRMFKRVYRKGPRDYRAECFESSADCTGDYVPGGGSNVVQ